MKCPECGVDDLRQVVHIIILCPADRNKFDKRVMRSADVEIAGADRKWFYCVNCGYNSNANSTLKSDEIP